MHTPNALTPPPLAAAMKRHNRASKALQKADAEVVAEVKRLRGLGWSEARINAHAMPENGKLPPIWRRFSAAYSAENKAAAALREMEGA